METVEIAVIGAGVIGIAIARALAREGHDVIVIEAASSPGTGASSRNSEVIHAGLYDPPTSLKTRLCVEGRRRLYEFCAHRRIAHRRCGKLVVATSASELATLARIAANARANAVQIEELDRSAVAALEPRLRCTAALWSPHSGILDTHQYLLALLADAQHHGAVCAYSSRVSRMWLSHDGTAIAVNGEEPSVRASLVVNAAGLEAPALASATEGFPREQVPRSQLAKGSYFALAGAAPFTHLIYPVPQAGGLGVHLTLDLRGRARFGPDVEWIAVPEYSVDPRRADRFYAAVRRYWPDLPDHALQPAYAGVRPKLCGPGEPTADFRIDGPHVHGAPIVQLFGIESPGLTASLALAEHVARLVAAA